MTASIVEAAYLADAPDYTRLVVLLTQLRNSIDSSNVKVLLDEIANAVNESDDAQLKTLLAPLFDSAGNIVDEELNRLLNNAAVDAVSDTLLELVDDAIEVAKEAKDAVEMKDTVDDLVEAISASYVSQLKTTLGKTYSLLKELQRKTSVIDEALADLAATEYTEATTSSSQVQLIIKQLREAVLERADFIHGLNEFTSFSDYTANTCVEFIRAAIKSTWLSYFSANIEATLDSYYSVFTQAFESSVENFNKLQLIAPTSKLVTTVLDVEAFKTLLGTVKPMLQLNEQNASNIDIVKSVGGLLLGANTLQDMLDADDYSNNLTIKNLIEDWQKAVKANDVKQKQSIQVELKEALVEAIDVNEQLFTIVANILCPSIAEYLNNTDMKADAESLNIDAFYKKLYAKLLELEKAILDRSDITAIEIADDSAYLNLLELPLAAFESALGTFNADTDALLSDYILSAMASAKNTYTGTYSDRLNDLEVLKSTDLAKQASEELAKLTSLKDDQVKAAFENFCTRIKEELERDNIADVNSVPLLNVLALENQLLAEIREIDVNREFYYTAPLTSSLAIDFNESSSALNTLMNPQKFYDVNNINNNFVISKLDIDFLDSGLQIARSSRLN
jgi:hypothetical protein